MSKRRRVTGDHPDYLTGEHAILLDLTDTDELPTETIDRYNRTYESGGHAAVVHSPKTRPRKRRRGARTRVSTSTSAADGWAARFTKLAGVRFQDEEPEK